MGAVPVEVPRRRTTTDPAGYYWYPLADVFESNDREVDDALLRRAWKPVAA